MGRQTMRWPIPDWRFDNECGRDEDVIVKGGRIPLLDGRTWLDWEMLGFLSLWFGGIPRIGRWRLRSGLAGSVQLTEQEKELERYTAWDMSIKEGRDSSLFPDIILRSSSLPHTHPILHILRAFWR